MSAVTSVLKASLSRSAVPCESVSLERLRNASSAAGDRRIKSEPPSWRSARCAAVDRPVAVPFKQESDTLPCR
ncbi:MAG: hypothetical protein D6741_15430 [Planctomycetota bacterium]|nr:MAG: hypothetical protein D6741_15430 [Planctomycetota bacterium]